MGKNASRPPSQRQLKVGELIRHALSDMFLRGDIYGPDREPFMITVSEVRTSPDLKNATVFVMPLAGKDKAKTVEQLNGLASMIRGELNRRVELRFSPALYFKLDDSFEKASHLENILRSPHVAQDLSKQNEE